MSVGFQSVLSGVRGSLNCFFKAHIIKNQVHQLYNMNFIFEKSVLGKMNRC